MPPLDQLNDVITILKDMREAMAQDARYLMQGVKERTDALRKTSQGAAIEHTLTAKFRQNEFENIIGQRFGQNAAPEIIDTFSKLGIATPKSGTEFLNSFEGAIVFTNKYGMTVRIENDKNTHNSLRADRINDNPWIMQPVGIIKAGDITIEICPGCHTTDNHELATLLGNKIKQTGASFWDRKANNVGTLPLRTPEFPQGIPVVIDRLAVRRMEGGTVNIDQAYKEMGVTRDPQDVLYGDLKDSFKRAWPDGAKAPDPALMQQFWKKCQEKLSHGHVVNGWNEKRDDTYKISAARNAAKAYDGRMTKPRTAIEQSDLATPSDLSTHDKIEAHQTRLLAREGVLPDRVTLNGQKVPLATALRDPTFNKNFKETLAKVQGKGEIDTTRSLKAVDQFNNLETTRKSMIATAPQIKIASPAMVAPARPAVVTTPTLRR